MGLALRGVMSLRSLLGVALILPTGAALYALFAPSASVSAAATFTSSAQCQDCHPEVYAEWKTSWHSRSWIDPEVRARSNDFANAECVSCHAPQPVFQTGIDERVLPRDSRREEGVDCIACHASADEGRVVGTLERADVACKPVAEADLSGPAFCAACHNQHETFLEWLVSGYAAQGIDCIDCHMPFRGGDPLRGRDHTMHGGHSLELLQAAVDLRARREGDLVRVEVENVGAGHCFPTDENSRAADVFWRPIEPAPGAWRFLYRFRSPFRDELDVEETVLPPHTVRELTIEDREAAGAIEVALFYKLTPYWADPLHPDPEAEARLVERVELEGSAR